MSRRTNLVNSVITMVAAVAAVLAVILVCNGAYPSATMGEVLALIIAGALIASFAITALHETAHLIAGRANRFAFVSVTIWFFRWYLSGNVIRFAFVPMGDAAGNTETVAKDTENLTARFRKMTAAPLWVTLIVALLGIIPLFFAQDMALWIYAFTSMFFPIGLYSFCSNALPASSGGVRNDGAVLYGIKKEDDESKVMLSLLKIQSELYAGKTPGEIEEGLYFDLPQLQEDSLNFILLLNARYAFYLDRGDFENAKKVSERLSSLMDYMPKPVAAVIKTDLLYNACTFDYNASRADELTYELEKFLNNVNTAENIRAKLAYILYVKKEKSGLADFYNKGIKEANKYPVKGLALYEKKLFLSLKQDVLKAEGIEEKAEAPAAAEKEEKPAEE